MLFILVLQVVISVSSVTVTVVLHAVFITCILCGLWYYLHVTCLVVQLCRLCVILPGRHLYSLVSFFRLCCYLHVTRLLVQFCRLCDITRHTLVS